MDFPLLIVNNYSISNGKSVASLSASDYLLLKNQQRQICIQYLPLLIPLLNYFSNGF